MVTAFPLRQIATTTEMLVAVQSASPLFRQAMRDDSNQALDWVWLAQRLSSRSERFASLRRALWIDPDYQPALEALERLMVEG